MALDINDIKINLYKEYSYSNMCVEMHHKPTGLEVRYDRFKSIAMNRMKAEQKLEKMVKKHEEDEAKEKGLTR